MTALVAYRGATQQDAHALMSLIGDCMRSGVARQALLVRLSGQRVPPHHLELAREALVPLSGADRARLFHLPDDNLVLVWRGVAEAALARCVENLRHLFAGQESAQDAARTSVLALPGEAARLLEIAEASLSPPPLPAAPHTERRPLDPARLASLETSLAHASLDRFVRRQPIGRATTTGFTTVWDAWSLSVDELFDTLLPDYDPRAEPWLLRRLTRCLDRRLLALLGVGSALREAGSFALDLNIASILSADFLRFDAQLPNRLRGEVILNLDGADILADAPAFLFARDFVRERGYRMLLRARPEQMTLLPPDRLDVDFLGLGGAWWTLAEAVRLPAPDRIVLHGVDAYSRLAWARSRGITHMQGRLVTSGVGILPPHPGGPIPAA